MHHSAVCESFHREIGVTVVLGESWGLQAQLDLQELRYVKVGESSLCVGMQMPHLDQEDVNIFVIYVRHFFVFFVFLNEKY